jgi:hypothetical protein
MMTNVTEKQESLWRLVAAPAVWAAHLLLSYVTAAIWCSKFTSHSGNFSSVRTAIGVYTLVALSLIAWVGWRGWQRHAHGASSLPHNADSASSRYRFLGFATLLLSGLSAVAVLLQLLPALFIGSCQ